MTVDDLTSDQFDRLRRLAHLVMRDASALGKTQGRQVIILASLIDGHRGKDIALHLGGKPSMVSNLKKRIERNGVEATLKQWEKAATRSEINVDDPPGKPGPKGIDSVDDWLRAHNSNGEPSIGIATMTIGPGANLVTFAVRDSTREFPGAGPVRTFCDIVRQTFGEPIIDRPPWTRISAFDAHFAGFIETVTMRFPALEVPGWREEIDEVFEKFHGEYGKEHSLFVLFQGDVAERYVTQWGRRAKELGGELNSENVFPASDPNEFFSRLDSTVYRLRQRWSCAGLLPMCTELYYRAQKWAALKERSPFLYHCDFEKFQKAVANAVLAWRYPAFFGALFHMSRQMWKQLNWSERFPLDTLAIRPKIALRSGPVGSNGYIASLRILPQLAYEKEFISRDAFPLNLRGLNKILRKRLDRIKAPKFVYSTVWMPHERWDELLNPSSSDAAILDSLEMGATLVPRHFLVTPELSKSQLSEYSDVAARSAGTTRVCAPGGTDSKFAFQFYSPALVDAIRRAFENNSYGDRIHDLERHLKATAKTLQGDWIGYPQAALAVDRFNPFRPSYWNLDPEFKDTESKDGERWKYWESKQSLARRVFLLAEKVSPTSSFEEILIDLDADFLLCHLSSADRSLIDSQAAEWAAEVQSFIQPLFDVDESSGRDRVIGSIEGTLRPQAAARKSELRSWVYDTLQVFSHNNRRIVRQAIEMAQRCVIAKLPPIAIVVEPEEAIMRRFAVLLGKRVKSQLIPRKSKKFEICGSDWDPESIDDLVGLASALARDGRNRSLVEDFSNQAETADLRIWRDVLAELKNLGNGEAIEAAVLEGLKICRSREEGTSQAAKIDALFSVFGNLIPSAKSSIKPPPRPNRGG